MIPASYESAIADDVTKLGALAGQAALTSTQGFGKTSFASVLTTVAVPEELQTKFIDLYTTAVGPARRTFWTDLEKNEDFTAEQVSTLRFGLLTGRLTRGYLPLITELAGQLSTGQITSARDLARLSSDDWLALLTKPQADGSPIGAPTFIDAETREATQQTYAGMLERFFTRAYPTTAFSARISADAKSPFPSAAPTAQFLDANPTFDLRVTNVDAFATKTQIPEAVLPTLLAAQRLVKVTPEYSVMSALMTAGISSAQQIYGMGRDRFVAEYATLADLGPTEAARTWAQAEQTHAVALTLTTKFNATLSSASPVAVGSVLPENVAAQIAQFPNLQTLFGSDSFCACEDCQSVLGDGAYTSSTSSNS